MKSTSVLTPAGKLITRTVVIGASVAVYEAWEPSSLTGDHMTLTHGPDGACYGAVASRRPTEAIKAMPKDERGKAIVRFFQANEAESRREVLAAFPEAAGGEESGGQIRVSLVSR
jgi:hypothetical protein